MVKTLYFDCFSGISGDMTIGALVDLGVDFEYLKTEIGKLPVRGFELHLSRTVRANISAAKFDVVIDPGPAGSAIQHDAHVHEHIGGEAHRHPPAHIEDPSHAPSGAHSETHAHAHRKASEIVGMIRNSGLAAGVRKRAVRIFEKLAVSEGRVHDLPPEEVEFHEVGAIDSIVDVVGTAIGLEALEVDRFLCSRINVGGGFIHCQHGVYPVPAPATANLLAHAPVYSRYVEKELVTPTGAAILAATIDRFGPLDGLSIERVGYGAGTNDLGRFPNCLRLFLGTGTEAREPAEDAVVVIESNIDDMSAEQLSYATEKLMGAGALDVLTIPVQMKKGRSGHLLQVLVGPGDTERMSRLIFEETTTIGVRTRTMDRRTLDRESVSVELPDGPVRVKVSRLGGRLVNISPEYEDCARVAREADRPFHKVREDALRAYRESTGERDENG